MQKIFAALFVRDVVLVVKVKETEHCVNINNDKAKRQCDKKLGDVLSNHLQDISEHL
eukprot:SAG31_NODE_494_length_14867_cov_2.833762_6_plen_57_part_00